MNVVKMILGQLQTNCFIAYNDRKEAVIIDPGDEPERIIEVITNKSLDPVGILVTHSHFDHIGAVDTVAFHYKLPVYTHSQEALDMENPNRNLSQYFVGKSITGKATHQVAHGQTLKLADELVFDCIEVPGHSQHSMCYYSENCLFSGDTLMNNTIGRTDLYAGSPSDLTRYIRERLLVLPDETRIYPGHGMVSTIEEEKRSNYLLRGF